jgi:phosphatidylinositol-3-phosphatase
MLKWLLLVVPALVACGAAPVALPRAAARPGSSRVIVVVMENEEAEAVIGHAPFVTRLARRGGLATRSYAIRHPSLPNYLALTGGSTFGIGSDCTSCHVPGAGIAGELDAAGVSWRAYMEDLPRPCFRGASAGGYAKKHDPFLYYDGLARCRRVVGFAALARDLRRGTMPTYAFISPNLCHDGHDCPLSTADRFLAQLVPPLLRALGPHGYLVLTWDEGSSAAGCCGVAHGGRIATLVLGPDVLVGGRDDAPVDHYGTLATIEDSLRLPRLGGARGARTLRALFRRTVRVR